MPKKAAKAGKGKIQKDGKHKGENIVITAALPYANGPIHLGHLVEYIQTDIYVRFLKLIGKKAIYVCADDTHGTPIEIKAFQLGINPEALIAKFGKEHQADFQDFQILFDSYYSTNSPENKQYSDLIFTRLKEKGHIYQKEIESTYCENCKRFLPDRFVKGKCPKCGAADQYGDVCEKCNAAYSTIELKDPYCIVCKSKPVRKKSRHYFFQLSKFSDKLRTFLEEKNLQPEVKHYVLNWIKEGLKDWDISRDGPYFGFKIPGEENIYYYVWLDAPVGYIASTAQYCKMHGKKIEDYWKKGSIIHFIGKDITYFHYLFWPALLMGSDFALPERIITHGFLTINGEKMSKSRGTFITAREYLEHLDSSYLRFYYASHLTVALEDLNLQYGDFQRKINNELVGNLANFFYRVLSFLNKYFDSQIGKFAAKDEIRQAEEYFGKIKEAYEGLNFRKAVHLILELSALGNKYFQEHEPWKLIKENKQKAHEAVSFCCNLAKNLAIVMKPVLPEMAGKLEGQLHIKDLQWKDLGFDLQNHKIGHATILVKKIEDELAYFQKKMETPPAEEEAIQDPFSQVDLRIAKILSIENHPDAEKLYVLQIDLGKEKRQLVAGLKPYYKAEELQGKQIVVVANLQPAKLRGAESQGMLLAGQQGEKVRILEPKGKPGERVFVESIASNPKKQISLEEFFQAKLEVKNGKPVYKGKVLKTAQGEVTIAEIREGEIR